MMLPCLSCQQKLSNEVPYVGANLNNKNTAIWNLSVYKMVIQFMTIIAKEKNINIDSPIEAQVIEMHGKVTCSVISLRFLKINILNHNGIHM